MHDTTDSTQKQSSWIHQFSIYVLYVISIASSICIGIDCGIINYHYLNTFSNAIHTVVILALISGLVLNTILYMDGQFEAFYTLFQELYDAIFSTNERSGSDLNWKSRFKYYLGLCFTVLLPIGSSLCMGLFTYNAYLNIGQGFPLVINPIIMITFSIAYMIGTFSLMRIFAMKLLSPWINPKMTAAIIEEIRKGDTSVEALMDKSKIIRDAYAIEGNPKGDEGYRRAFYRIIDSLKKNHQIHEENGMLSCTNSETNSWVTGSITAILSVIFSAAMATTTLAWQAGAQAVLSSWPLTSGASNLIAWVIAGMLLASEIMFCVSLAYTLSQKIQMTQDKNAQHKLSPQSIVIGIFTFILPACMISFNAYANGIIAESTLQHYQFLFIALGTCLSLSIMSNAVAAFDKNAIIPSKIPNTAQQFSSTMQTHFKYLLAFTVISCAYYLGPFTNGMIQPLITQPNVITLISIAAPFILISICFALKTLYQNLNTELTISHPLPLIQQQQQQQQPLPTNPQRPENTDDTSSAALNTTAATAATASPH